MGATSTASVGGGGGYRGVDRRIDAAGAEPRPLRELLGVVLLPSLAVAGGVSLLVAGNPAGALRPATSVAAPLAFLVSLTGFAIWRAFGRATGYLAMTAGALLGLGLIVRGAAPDLPPVIGAVPVALASMWVARAAIGPAIDTVNGPRREGLRAALAIGAGWAMCGLLLLTAAPADRALEVLAASIAGVAWSIAVVVTVSTRARRRTPLPIWLVIIVTGLFAAIGAAATPPLGSWAWEVAIASLMLAGLATSLAGMVWWLTRGVLGWRDATYDVLADQRADRRRVRAQQRSQAHEIRTALLAVEGALCSLERDDAADRTDRRQLGDAAKASLLHVRQLLDGELQTSTNVRVRDLVDERVLLAVGRGHLTAHVDGDPDLHAGDAAIILTQVIDNLLANAERHAAGGTRAHVGLTLEQLDDTLRLRYADDGPGIPEDKREAIFAAGCQLDHGRGGDGLGLAIIRRALRERGGDITATYSTAGAVFEVALPLEAAGGQGTDEPDDGVEVRELGLEAPSEEPAATSGFGLVVQLHHQLGTRLRGSRGHDGKVEDLVG